jgi:4-amino-4-deoxy-L-arabinose transferase-like glycosyltransferase
VINPSLRRNPLQLGISDTDAVNPYLTWLLCLVCVVVLFVNLGSADFFEPDEGRNAEKAREILLLNDWVTPHENFLPVLDKPMFFYWLVALSYKIFGIAEWSARLPSTVFALGCLLLVYRFTYRSRGSWEALWSVLILLTSVEFFLLARIVRSDMTLTFCVTLALCSFYSAIHAENEKAKKLDCLLMYGALGAGTLVKGLIGLVIPGMVFFVYLLLTNKWSILRRLHLLPGALLFLVIVTPWYLWVDERNPGYLRYFFWDEHFTRYLTDEFNRSQRWFYFFFVTAVGFFPWTLLLPFVVKDSWQKINDKKIFLILWVVLPLLFFSASNSKLPHYILPIYPALAILTGRMITGFFNKPQSTARWVFYWPWILLAGFVFYLLIGGVWQRLLPTEIQATVSENLSFIGLSAALMVLIFGGYAYANLRGYWSSQIATYISTCVVVAVFFLLVGHLMVTASVDRSAKALAQSTAPFITHDSQMVIYDTYMPGLIFYLRLDRPIWIVASPGKTTLMGSPYVSTHRPDPASGHGKILFNFAEFSDAWKKANPPLLVFAKAKTLLRLESQLAEGTKKLAGVDEYVLVSKP